ncbi:MAG: DUF1850 domain-containing protein [Spirochaetes bacterium]|nr:DUF1850 domain-containing protein [Spirochaetota bacterium]
MGRRSRTALVIAAAAAIAVAAAFFIRPACLALRDPAGRAVGLFPLGPDARFELSHRHSVAKLPWVEWFRVGPGDVMVLYRTRYGAFGAGLPSGDEGGTVSLEDGWIVIDGMDRRFPRVALSPSSFTEHRLAIGRRAWALWPLVAGRTPVTMAVDRQPLGLLVAWTFAHACVLRRSAVEAGSEPVAGTGEGD